MKKRVIIRNSYKERKQERQLQITHIYNLIKETQQNIETENRCLNVFVYPNLRRAGYFNRYLNKWLYEEGYDYWKNKEAESLKKIEKWESHVIEYRGWIAELIAEREDDRQREAAFFLSPFPIIGSGVQLSLF